MLWCGSCGRRYWLRLQLETWWEVVTELVELKTVEGVVGL